MVTVKGPWYSNFLEAHPYNNNLNNISMTLTFLETFLQNMIITNKVHIGNAYWIKPIHSSGDLHLPIMHP